RTPRRSHLRTQWSSWTSFLLSSMTGIGRSPACPSSASCFFIPFLARSECSRRAPFWGCLQRSWRHVRPRSQLRDELVGYELTRHERSILLPAEGSLVQRRRLDVGKAASSQRDLPGPGPLQLEERVRSGVPVARDWQDIPMLTAPPIRWKDAPAVRAPHLRDDARRMPRHATVLGTWRHPVWQTGMEVARRQSHLDEFARRSVRSDVAFRR